MFFFRKSDRISVNEFFYRNDLAMDNFDPVFYLLHLKMLKGIANEINRLMNIFSSVCSHFSFHIQNSVTTEQNIQCSPFYKFNTAKAAR